MTYPYDRPTARVLRDFMTLFDTRNALVCDISCSEEFEAWSRARRRAVAFARSIPPPPGLEGIMPPRSWYTFTGRRWVQVFATSMKRDV